MLDHRLAGGGEVANSPRHGPARVLHRDRKRGFCKVMPCVVHVLLPDVGGRVDDSAPPEHLDLQALGTRAVLGELSQQTPDGMAAVAQRVSCGRIRASRQHEMIDAAHAGLVVPHARGDAGAEHGRDDFVLPGDVDFTRQHLRDPLTQRAVEVAVDVTEAPERRRGTGRQGNERVTAFQRMALRTNAVRPAESSKGEQPAAGDSEWPSSK